MLGICGKKILPASLLTLFLCATSIPAKQPNILFAISDDQSYPHTSAYGYPAIDTPAFDRVAKAGVLFENAFAPSPGCSPSRAAMLTGRYPWQIEHAGTHASEFPKKYLTYPDLLENAGYWIGYTGKGWGPGNYKISGRLRNPAGPSFSSAKLKSTPTSGISSNDYAGNFREFLKKRPADKPFYFWFGATEPHRGFEKGSGLNAGKKLADADVPDFLPDTPEIRSDLLDYCLEIEHFDNHLAQMLAALEEIGELENTIVIVTADNGMAFPRAKANLYEYGIHLPLAIAWPAKIPGGRSVDDIVNLIDVAPTLLEAAGVTFPADAPEMSARSLANTLFSEKSGRVDPTRNLTFSSRERHSSSRWNNLSYPQRCIRTDRFLYIRNFKPERWPAGTPETLGKDGKPNRPHSGYHDIDACPTLTFMVENREPPRV